MVVFDSSFLLLLLDDKASVPHDPATKKPWEKGRSRIEYLLDRLSAAETSVIIPTPVLAEILVRTGGATSHYLTKIATMKGIQVASFDQKAAVELAVMTASALSAGNKRGIKALNREPWQKLKVDRQIIAVAKSLGATGVYSCDEPLLTLARHQNLDAFNIGDLPFPPVKSQVDFIDTDNDE